MKRILSLAYSTCPNDTYTFYALSHQKIDCGGLGFKTALMDIERLNQAAKDGRFDFSKLSFAAMGHLMDSYGLLRTGAALGRGCGPLIVGRGRAELAGLKNATIAVPGLWTTAALLLRLYMEKPADLAPLPFDQIMPAVQAKTFDFGVIIHEGRFTYKHYGLECLLDLGAWWEAETGLPVPLGGIAARRDIPCEVARGTTAAIKKSIEYAHAHPSEADGYIRKHAQELSNEVIKQHIDLYVNAFSLDLGQIGEKAVHTLFLKARQKKILPESDKPVFACG